MDDLYFIVLSFRWKFKQEQIIFLRLRKLLGKNQRIIIIYYHLTRLKVSVRWKIKHYYRICIVLFAFKQGKIPGGHLSIGIIKWYNIITIGAHNTYPYGHTIILYLIAHNSVTLVYRGDACVGGNNNNNNNNIYYIYITMHYNARARTSYLRTYYSQWRRRGCRLGRVYLFS